MMKVVDKMLDWENAGTLKLLRTGYSLREPQLLFRKIEDEEIEVELKRLQDSLQAKNIKLEELNETELDLIKSFSSENKHTSFQKLLKVKLDHKYHNILPN